MTRLLLALILCLSAISANAVSAASPEQDYLAARDAYIKAFEHGYTGSDIDKHQRALADLEAQLRRIVGPTTLEGFPAEGKIHLDTLSTEDQGFGLLDGLAYTIPLDDKGIDEKVSVVVTTRSLFEAWLRAHKTKWWGQNPLPQDLQAALRSDEFYRQALSTDAAVVTYAQLPVAKSSWAKLAFAVLATRTQDLIGSTPTEMDIVVTGSERVYMVTAKTAVAVGPIAACEKSRRQLKAQADAAQTAYLQSGSKNEALLDKSSKLEEQADRAYVQCFATRARNETSFAAAVKQAQALIDMLPKQ
jgi:hypothetical protein